jgi:hypothetical protein
MIVLQAAMAAGEHWRDLPEADRRRLRELLAKSRGRPSNLSRRERDELRALVRRVDVPGFARRMAPLGRRTRRR